MDADTISLQTEYSPDLTTKYLSLEMTRVIDHRRAAVATVVTPKARKVQKERRSDNDLGQAGMGGRIDQTW